VPIQKFYFFFVTESVICSTNQPNTELILVRINKAHREGNYAYMYELIARNTFPREQHAHLQNLWLNARYKVFYKNSQSAFTKNKKQVNNYRRMLLVADVASIQSTASVFVNDTLSRHQYRRMTHVRATFPHKYVHSYKMCTQAMSILIDIRGLCWHA
jgi:hypothetical protein